MAASDTDRKQKSKAFFIAAPGIESSIMHSKLPESGGKEDSTNIN